MLSQENHAEFVLTKSLILLMAVICGVCVANLYYIQPLEAQVASDLIFLLETPLYRMGAREAGLFGFAGVAGALAAPLIGKMADRKSPRFPIGIAVLLSTLAYAVFALFGNRLWGLILGVVILDLGNQGGQVSNQARIHSIGDEARSRNNMIFMFSYFIGGAAGSFLGTLSWQKFGWAGVCAVGFLFQAAALIFHFLVYRPRHPAAAA